VTAAPSGGGRAVVAGFGVTGRAVAEYLAGRGEEVLVVEDHPTADMQRVADRLGVRLERFEPGRLAGARMVVPSPGIPPQHPVYAEAARRGVPVVSEIELAWAAAGGPRLVAITGTNGKTTVTTLVDAILRRSGLRSTAAGNIGVPLIEAVRGGVDVVVAEVSSFQLQFTAGFRPEVSCWLNLAPDHLDWHPSFDDYAGAKSKVWANQREGDTAVFNCDDPLVATRAGSIPGGVTKAGFSTSRPASYSLVDGRLVAPGGEPILAVAELPRALPHDVSNALAAAAVALSAGAGLEACRQALAEAPALPHRVELVAQAEGVSWYDDSKATTPASVLAAVAGFDSVVLIAGGRNKGLDLGALAGAVPPVKAAVAIGEAAGEVVEALSPLVDVKEAATMQEAVEQAARLARPGDAVILSPGCASFDWYRSYAARGEDFAAAVRELMDKGGA
jgi:UDP-N-acetylmuramoylalanine--D-glutamate ligase